MTIIRIDSQSFNIWRDQIEVMLDRSVKLNFPDSKVDIDYGKARCDSLADYLDRGMAIVFAATEGDKLAGWIWCHEIRRISENRLHIAEIAVDDDLHNRGIGKNLLQKVERYASENGHTAIDLLVTKSNEAAVRFYEKSSYEIERYVMRKSL